MKNKVFISHATPDDNDFTKLEHFSLLNSCLIKLFLKLNTR